MTCKKKKKYKMLKQRLESQKITDEGWPICGALGQIASIKNCTFLLENTLTPPPIPEFRVKEFCKLFCMPYKRQLGEIRHCNWNFSLNLFQFVSLRYILLVVYFQKFSSSNLLLWEIFSTTNFRSIF